MTRPKRIIFAVATVYVSWIAMMAIHESGHVLAGTIGGGHVQRVVIPPFGFSRTDVWPDPSPRLETWGGPVWGSVVPLVLWLVFRKKLQSAFGKAFGFFTGLCLVANGAYLGIGWSMGAGDAADLVKLGTPVWMLIAFGFPATIMGFYIWHTLGSLEVLFANTGGPPVPRK